jgi:hypothetical protein
LLDWSRLDGGRLCVLASELGSITGETAMRIKKHDAIWWNLVDGSAWRIWLSDIPKTLEWLPTTEIDVADIDD